MRGVLDVAVVRVPVRIGRLVGAAEARPGRAGSRGSPASRTGGSTFRHRKPHVGSPWNITTGGPSPSSTCAMRAARRRRGSAAPRGSPAGLEALVRGAVGVHRRGSLKPQPGEHPLDRARPSPAGPRSASAAREMYIAASSSAPTTRWARGSTGWRAIRPVSIAFSSDAFTRPRPYWASISRHSSQPRTLGASVIMIRWIAGSVHASRNASDGREDLLPLVGLLQRGCRRRLGELAARGRGGPRASGPSCRRSGGRARRASRPPA